MQAGFTAQDGCKINISLLGEALFCMKADTGGVVTVVDIAKAFHTIPHQVAVRLVPSCARASGIEWRATSTSCTTTARPPSLPQETTSA